MATVIKQKAKITKPFRGKISTNLPKYKVVAKVPRNTRIRVKKS